MNIYLYIYVNVYEFVFEYTYEQGYEQICKNIADRSKGIDIRTREPENRSEIRRKDEM